VEKPDLICGEEPGPNT